MTSDSLHLLEKLGEQLGLDPSQVRSPIDPQAVDALEQIWGLASTKNRSLAERDKLGIIGPYGVMLSNLASMTAYYPDLYDGPVRLMRALKGIGNGTDDGSSAPSECLGWSELLPALDVVSIEGDHRSIVNPKHQPGTEIWKFGCAGALVRFVLGQAR